MSHCHGAGPVLDPGDGAEIALVGNPNTGKSTLFNVLTGSRQHVGNWPGKTVERRQGELYLGTRRLVVVDLPGTYALAAVSPEEAITRDHLLGGAVVAVVLVLDATHLERNLFLGVQVLELGLPTVVALNMVDVLRRRGIRVDREHLAERLGVPVVETVARRGIGVDRLAATLGEVLGIVEAV